MRPARAAPSAACRRCSIRAASRCGRSRRRDRTTCSGTIWRASSSACRRTAPSRSSTAPGTGASWSSASKASPASANGSAPIARSTTSNAPSPITARGSSRSSCTSRRKSSCAVSRTACAIPRSAGSSATRISATATNGRTTRKPPTTCSRKTSTDYAPWHAIPAENKKYARVAALKVIAKRLAAGVDLSPVTLDPQVIAEARKILEIDDALLVGVQRRRRLGGLAQPQPPSRVL